MHGARVVWCWRWHWDIAQLVAVAIALRAGAKLAIVVTFGIAISALVRVVVCPTRLPRLPHR